MKKITFYILYKLGFFKDATYEELEKWGVEDICNNKIYWS